MGDRSYFALRFYEVPPEEDAPIREFLFGEGWDSAGFPITEPLVNDDSSAWDVEEMLIGSYQEIGRGLMAVAPGSTFACWNDTKYEWLGGLFMHAPGLGEFVHDCDSNGTAVFGTDEVLRLLAQSRAEFPDFAAVADVEFARLLGKPWEDAIEAARRKTDPKAVGKDQVTA